MRQCPPRTIRVHTDAPSSSLGSDPETSAAIPTRHLHLRVKDTCLARYVGFDTVLNNVYSNRMSIPEAHTLRKSLALVLLHYYFCSNTSHINIGQVKIWLTVVYQLIS